MCVSVTVPCAEWNSEVQFGLPVDTHFARPVLQVMPYILCKLSSGDRSFRLRDGNSKQLHINLAKSNVVCCKNLQSFLSIQGFFLCFTKIHSWLVVSCKFAINTYLFIIHMLVNGVIANVFMLIMSCRVPIITVNKHFLYLSLSLC